MYDYGSFCYLDVQKTGSTFVGRFLKNCSNIPLVSVKKHRGIEQAQTYDPRCFYFISVRDPASSYASLFNYGCDGEGRLFQYLKRNGLEKLYGRSEAQYYRWLDFLFDERNAAKLGPNYRAAGERGIGFASYRFARLALVDSKKVIRYVAGVDELIALYREKNIAQFTLRNENLASDTRRLVTDVIPQFFDPVKVETFLAGGKINASKSEAVSRQSIMKWDGVSEFLKRERLLIEAFYPHHGDRDLTRDGAQNDPNLNICYGTSAAGSAALALAS